MFFTLFSIVAPVFICAAVGYGWRRSGRPYDTDLVTTLVTGIGAPCLAFQVLMEANVSMTNLSVMAGATVAALFGNAIVGFLALRAFKQPLRAFLPSVIFGNSGNMGLPLTLLAFGEEGLALAIGVFVIHAAGHFVVGSAIASGSTSVSQILKMPMIWAVVIAVGLRLGDISVPDWILDTTGLLAGMTIPLMLITLGISLSGLKVASLGRAFGVSALRLGSGFVMGLSMAELFGLEGLARAVLILELTMPCAVFNYLFAARYKQRPEEVAGMVLISTLMSFATLPILLWYLIEAV